MIYSAGFLIYDGFDLQDMAAVYHLLAHAAHPDRPETPLFTLHTVARTKEIVTCYGGAQLLPDHIYPDAHIYDVILVPGGPGYQEAMKFLRLMDWINRASKLAQVVAAVNTGIYLLAASRQLNNRSVAAVPGLTETYPGLQTVAEQPLVQSEKFLTIPNYKHSLALAVAVIERLEGSTAVNYLNSQRTKDSLP
jgi:transcriptional regulator GlxA family with amidase domain